MISTDQSMQKHTSWETEIIRTDKPMYRGWHLMDETTDRVDTFKKAIKVETNHDGGVWITASENEARRYCKHPPYAMGEYRARKELTICNFKSVSEIISFVDLFKADEFLGQMVAGELVTNKQAIENVIAALEKCSTPNCNYDHIFGKFFKKVTENKYHGYSRQSFSSSIGQIVDEYYIVSEKPFDLFSWTYFAESPIASTIHPARVYNADDFNVFQTS
jgi:hypothetical protein